MGSAGSSFAGGFSLATDIPIPEKIKNGQHQKWSAG